LEALDRLSADHRSLDVRRLKGRSLAYWLLAFHRHDELGKADIQGADDASNCRPSGVYLAALDARE
jgi:hypothetical protein